MGTSPSPLPHTVFVESTHLIIHYIFGYQIRKEPHPKFSRHIDFTCHKHILNQTLFITFQSFSAFITPSKMRCVKSKTKEEEMETTNTSGTCPLLEPIMWATSHWEGCYIMHSILGVAVTSESSNMHEINNPILWSTMTRYNI